jgi:predicted permease
MLISEEGKKDVQLAQGHFSRRSIRRADAIEESRIRRHGILTLALGLGVNLTVFLFVSDFFLRPLPVKDPKQLVYVMQSSPRFGVPLGFSFPDYRDLRDAIEGKDGQNANMASAFSGLLAYSQTPIALSRSGTVTERTWVAAASDNFFDVLGVSARHGRLFAAGEGRNAGADPIIVLTYDYWMKRFGGDPGIIGQPVMLNSLAFTVVGVTAPGFHGPQWADAMSGFVPFTMLPALQPADPRRLENRGQLGVMVMGRLRPGAPLAQARAAADVALARLIAQYSEEHLPAKALVIPERMSRPAPAATSYTPLIISVLMLGALLVLAVAIINVTNLLFARAVDRERELAVRSAIGASRARLVRQQLVEALFMALLAGGLGAWLAHWAGAWLESSVAVLGDIPPAAKYGADWRVFACTVGLALAAGTLAALVPALKATHHAIVPLLKETAPTTAAARHPLRSLLVIGQVALSCVVLIAAGLGARSVNALARVDLGFQPANVLLASYDLGLQRYVQRNGLERARQFHAELLERVRALPGVRAASLAEDVPFDVNPSVQGDVAAEGAPPSRNSGSQLIPVAAVEQAYLQALGIPIVAGRNFAATDKLGAPRVAIINKAMAKRLWADARAVGKRIHIGGGRPAFEVVGVVGNGRYMALADRERPCVFLPLAQNFRGGVTLVVRADGEPLALAPAIERIVRKMEPDLPLYNVRTMEQQVTASPLGLMPMRFGATIVGAQGLLVLMLALTGIYGLVSFNVSRRAREIGLRVALGARPWAIARLVTRQSLVLAGIGLAIGLPTAFVAMQPLGRLLYGVGPGDLFVYASVAFLIVAITLAACWLPARRATKVDPMTALRAE